MKTKLTEGEQVIRKGKANHFVGITNVGGNLYLTNKRVIFETNALNFIQEHTWSLEYNNIKEIGKKNTLFIIPNGITLISNDNKTDRFVVFGRDKWIKDIKEKIELS